MNDNKWFIRSGLISCIVIIVFGFIASMISAELMNNPKAFALGFVMTLMACIPTTLFLQVIIFAFRKKAYLVLVLLLVVLILFYVASVFWYNAILTLAIFSGGFVTFMFYPLPPEK